MALHQGSVRCLAYMEKTGQLASGSIDKSVKLYQAAPQKGHFEFDREFNYHESFVYALTPQVEGNGFFSGSKDMKIMHIDAAGNPSRIYEGHTGPVCSLQQVIPGELVSGSWDGTCKVWDTETGQVKYNMEGHSHATTVLALPNGVVITGSQDKAIRIWF